MSDGRRDDSDEVDASLVTLLHDELRDHTATLRALAGDEVPSPAAFAAAHSLRGALRIMGLSVTERLARAMEATLVIDPERPARLGVATVDALRRGAGLLAAAVTIPTDELMRWDRERVGEVDALITALLLASGRRRPPPTAAPVGVDRQLLDIFRVEAETHAAALSDGLLQLEADPTRPEPIDGLMRAAHSMKGAARVLGLIPLVQLAHAMEDALVAARSTGAGLGAGELERLLQATDLIAEVARQPAIELPAWVSDHASGLAEAAAVLRVRPRGDGPRDRPVASTVPAASIVPVAPVAPAPVAATVPVAPVAPPSLAATLAAGEPASPQQLAQTAAILLGRHDGDQERVVRVSAAVIDRLMSLAGESLVESRRLEPFADALRRQVVEQARLGSVIDQLAQAVASDAPAAAIADLVARAKAREVGCRRHLGERVGELEDHVRRADDLGRRLYGEAIASRMRPLADGVRSLPRAVRDLSRALGKQVALTISGERVGVDRDILERLEAPLTHLVRNAIDHGVESPDDRAAAGKPARGQLRLEAYQRAGYLVIQISDDGRGIDVDRVRARLIGRGLVTAEVAAAMVTGDVLEHLFLPGFSTADQVTEISGRGVGLDVVHSVVHELGGAVRITSRLGQGTTFHLQLPITRSVVRALVVEIAGDAYAFPLGRIHRVVELPVTAVRTVEGRPFFNLEGRSVGLVEGHQILELDGPPPSGDELCVVVVGERSQQLGVVVDRLVGESDLVVRRLDPRLGKVADVSAAAVLADGRPALILDVDDLRRSVAAMLGLGALGRVTAAAAAPAPARRRKHVLVADDSITVRELERTLLVNRGFQVTTAVDGVEAWHAVRAQPFDLVITDVDMPRMDGIELVRSLKQDPALRSIPVMIVSYRDREEDRLRGLEAGANHYLTKSNFHDDRLLAAAVELIGEPDAG